ncbi:amidohydrolase [Sporanaerobium hydrogeniformans]|uniref:Amidohydrolase n=1 Tax=Sporanaerobium hydrogeniformans TaxID=3072179 RepID=A0AC61DEB6_9FIRM|nr:amidohydrolase [Sporanaerobium hydrogeniformans]PHV71403.1 amidohydrolase [Sporanaerobium hydrogeniformans]
MAKEKLYFNGDILTLEENLYVEALLIKEGKIYKVGSKEELLKVASKEVEQVDLEGKTIMPSFMDAHSHFSGYAISFNQVNLREMVSFAEIADAIKEFIEKNHISPGKWVQAEGYDPHFLDEKAHPTRQLLDEAAPHNPVLAKHKSGHMGVFNTLALNELGITPETPNPEGGIIEKKEGQLTGYMEETAYIHAVQQLPMVSNEEMLESMRKAQNAYASYGITTAQEGFLSEQLVSSYHYLMQSNLLKIDLIGYIDISKVEILKEKFANCLRNYTHHFKIGGYKTFLDGSPQGRTAWMRTPYVGKQKDYYGYGTQKDEQIEKKLERALKDNMQILVHCNGDAACEQYIMQYAKAKEKNPSNKDIRAVMIHAQLLDLDQLERVKALDMLPSFFISHIYHWGDIHIKNFTKERASRISPAQSALEKGIRYTFHQDSPVIEPNMLETIWCAVNRLTQKGIVLGAHEKISPLDALKAVTCNVAYQYFEEDRKGTIKEGKLADLVIVDKNILKVAPAEIKNIQVLETIKEGETIYRREV